MQEVFIFIVGCNPTRLFKKNYIKLGEHSVPRYVDCLSHVPYEDVSSKELIFIKSVEKYLDLHLKNPSFAIGSVNIFLFQNGPLKLELLLI